MSHLNAGVQTEEGKKQLGSRRNLKDRGERPNWSWDETAKKKKEMTNLARCPAVYGRLRSPRSLRLVYPRNLPAARKSVRVCGWNRLDEACSRGKDKWYIYIIYQWKLPKLYFFFSIVEDTFRIRLIVLVPVVLDVQDSFDRPRMPKTCLNNGCL